MVNLSTPQVIWQPQPGPQTALLQCPVFEVFYGGARGGGKTDGMIGDWLQHSALYGELAVGIFVRRNRTQLSEVIARTKQLFPKIGGKYNETKSEWLMPGGARLRFVYLERDSDAENYQGHNYTRVYIEEVTNFPSPGPIDKLRATLRGVSGVPVAMRLTGNPGGPGHNWVKHRYIDPDPQGFRIVADSEEVVLSDGGKIEVRLERVFIPSKLKDNALLLDSQPTYILQLRQAGSEQLVRAWLDGDWSSIQGAYFSDFSPDKHVLPASVEATIPRHWTRFRAMDWGSAKPFSVGWYAVSDGTFGFPKGAIIKYREFYGWNGKPNQGLKMNATAVAQAIIALEAPDLARGIRTSYGLADPSIFVQDGGPSIAEMMLAAGCQWGRADNKRIAGWEQLHIRFQSDPPGLYFLESCEHTIRTIATLQHDEGRPEDLDSDGEDHAADETRYACASHPLVSFATKRAEPWAPPRGVGQYTFNDLLKLNERKLREKDW
jgi:hypothetical protein